MGCCLPTISVIYGTDPNTNSEWISYEYVDSGVESLEKETIYGLQLAYVKKFCRNVQSQYDSIRNAGGSKSMHECAKDYLLTYFGESDFRMFMT